MEEIQNVKTGQVTYAVRDTQIDDKEIHEGDIMGIGDAGHHCSGYRYRRIQLRRCLQLLVDEDSELDQSVLW